MAGPTKPYARKIVQTFREDLRQEQRRTLPAVDTAEVLRSGTTVAIAPHGGTATYEDDYVLWLIDPDSLESGDQVVIARDPDENPIVVGKIDGLQPDPSLHPDYIGFKRAFVKLQGDTNTWKGPVATTADLPTKGNQRGDIRLVLSTNTLYSWNDVSAVWVALAGDSGTKYLDDLLDVSLGPTAAGQVLEFNGTSWVNVPEHWIDTTGDTMTGDLIMTAGTMITLPDAPMNATDVVNKEYVDSALAAIAEFTAIHTLIVDSDYSFAPDDHMLFVDCTSGPITITLPAAHSVDKIYEVKDYAGFAATNNITITSSGGDLIDGLGTTATLTVNHQSFMFLSDGTDWWII